MATEPDPPNYFAFRELVAGEIRRGELKPISRSRLIVRAWNLEVPDDEAREVADRFLADLTAGAKKRRDFGQLPPEGQDDGDKPAPGAGGAFSKAQARRLLDTPDDGPP